MPKKQVFVLFIVVVGFAAVFGYFGVVAASTSKININNRARETSSRYVTLYFDGPSDAKYMRIANDPVVGRAGWEPYVARKEWTLDYGGGTKTVYVQFRDRDGGISSTYSDTIILKVLENITTKIEVNGGKFSTDSRYVIVSSTISEGVETMQVSNKNDFEGIRAVPVRHLTSWVLSEGSGEKEVYVRFRDVSGEFHLQVGKINYTEPTRFIQEGTLVKGQGGLIYYFGFDGKLHPFRSLEVYHSWYEDFDNIQHVSNAKLSEYRIGKPVSVRPGTWLVRFSGGGSIYAVEPGYKLRPIRSIVEASILYGSNWQERIIDLGGVERSFYKIRSYEIEGDDIDDNDKDGIDSETEKKYNTSDRSSDTDGDGLSDYEEIFYWFSDPKRRDTDGDGVVDSQALLSGFLPVGGESFDKIPDGTYTYPQGSLVNRGVGNKDLYDYYYYDGSIRNFKVSKKKNSFIENNIQSVFTIKPFLIVPRRESVKHSIRAKNSHIVYPTTVLYSGVVAL